MTLDLPKLRCLLSCAHDIAAVRIPQVRAQHSACEQVELAVADMYVAVADCLDQAAKLLAEDGHHEASVAHLGNTIRGVLTKVEDCYAEAAAWREVPLWVAMAECEGKTLH